VPPGAPRFAPHLQREFGGFRFGVGRDNRRVEVGEARIAQRAFGAFGGTNESSATARAEKHGREPSELAPGWLVGDDHDLVRPREALVSGEHICH